MITRPRNQSAILNYIKTASWLDLLAWAAIAAIVAAHHSTVGSLLAHTLP